MGLVTDETGLALAELDVQFGAAVESERQWLTAGQLEPPDDPSVEPRRRLGLDTAGTAPRAITALAAAELLMFALQVQLNLDPVGARTGRDIGRAIVDGDIVLARAMAIAADLGAEELLALADVLDEISLDAVTSPILDGTTPTPGDMLAEAQISPAVLRFVELAISDRQPPLVSNGAASSDDVRPAPDWEKLVEHLALAPLAADLTRVEETMVEMLTVPGQPEVTEAISYIVTAGGKRLRPILVLMGNYAGQSGPLQPAPPEAVEIAAAIELLHVFTLYHDDVIDHAATRRGMPTAASRWGSELAIGLGNAMCARSFAASARVGQPFGQLMAASLLEVCRGQGRELTKLFDVCRTEHDYLSSVGGKTAFLLASAARFGAMTAPDAEPELVDGLWAAAFHYGVAFQVIDDLLDLLSHEEQLKKPAGSDVVEGVYSLPVIMATRVQPELRRLLSSEPSPEDIDELRLQLAASRALPDALEYTIGHCTSAQLAMAESPGMHPEVRQALTSFEDVLFAPLVAAGVEVRR